MGVQRRPGSVSGSATVGGVTFTITMPVDDSDAHVPGRVAHGEWFSWVRVSGRRYDFADRRQRLVVAALWQAYMDDQAWVDQEVLMLAAELRGVGNVTVLADLFAGHPAWGELIESGLFCHGPVGSYRLVVD